MNLQEPKRLGLPHLDVASKFGPLQELIGTWSGNQGVNLIAVPDQKGSFKLLVAPYYETIKITPLNSLTPNRGLESIEKIPTLMYSLMIHDATNNGLMHAENGIIELLDPTNNNGLDLARISTVPHGDAVMALGNSSVLECPVITDLIDGNLSSLPTGDIPILGYTEGAYEKTYVKGFNTSKPNQYLIDHLEQQKAAGKNLIKSVNLKFNTANGGGINNIPSLNKKAVNASSFDSTFWVETIEDVNTGQISMQLQYSQNTMIDFPVKENTPGQTIHWPHINVNTLVKQ